MDKKLKTSKLYIVGVVTIMISFLATVVGCCIVLLG